MMKTTKSYLMLVKIYPFERKIQSQFGAELAAESDKSAVFQQLRQEQLSLRAADGTTCLIVRRP